MSLENFDIPAFTQRVKEATQGAVEILKAQGFNSLKILQTLEENSDDIDAWAMGYEKIPMSVAEAVFEEMGTPLTTSMRDSYVRGRREGAEDRQEGPVSPEPSPRSADEDEITEAFFEESGDEVPVREGRFSEIIEASEGTEADTAKENLEFLSDAVAELIESPLWENRSVSVGYDPETGEVSRFEQWKSPDGFRFVRLVISAPLESPESLKWEASGDVGNGLTGTYGDFEFLDEEEADEEFENAQEGAAEEIERLLGSVRVAAAPEAELTTTQETFLEGKRDEAFDEDTATREEELETGDPIIIGKYLLGDVMAELGQLPGPYNRWKPESEVLAKKVVQLRFTPLGVDNPQRQAFTYIIDGAEGVVLFSGGNGALRDRLDEIDDWPSYARATVREGHASLQLLGRSGEENIPGTTGGFSDAGFSDVADWPAYARMPEEEESAEELTIPSDILLKAFQGHLFDISQEFPYSGEVGEALLGAEIKGDGDKASLNFSFGNVDVELSALQNPKPHIAWNIFGSGDDAHGSMAFFEEMSQSEHDERLAKIAKHVIKTGVGYLNVEEEEFTEEDEYVPDLPVNEDAETDSPFDDLDAEDPSDYKEEIEAVAEDTAEGDDEDALSLARDIVAAITVHQQPASEAFTEVLTSYPFITPEGAEIANETAAALLEEWEYFPVEEVMSRVYPTQVPEKYRMRFESDTGMLIFWTIYNYPSPAHVLADDNIGTFEILSRVHISATECPNKRISVASQGDIYLQKKPKVAGGPSHIVTYLNLPSALTAVYKAAQNLENSSASEACRSLLEHRTTPVYSKSVARMFDFDRADPEEVSSRYTLNPETGNLFEFPYFAE